MKHLSHLISLRLCIRNSIRRNCFLLRTGLRVMQYMEEQAAISAALTARQ
jgi:hypothetical protein